MEVWIKISLLLCLFGFLKEFRPSEPFLVDYLTGPRLNFTAEQLNQSIFPLGTYVYMGLLVLVFLITDMLRYKPIIVVEGMAGIVSWSIFAWGWTYDDIMVAQTAWGLFSAAEVAYYTYIYARVDKEHYHRVTSHTRTAILLGHSISALVGQVLYSTQIMSSHTLTYITVAAISLSTIWAILLPPVKKSIYFHRYKEKMEEQDEVNVTEDSYNQLASSNIISCSVFKSNGKAAVYLLWRDFVGAYTQKYVLIWSIWWAWANACYLQAYGYNQVLYQSILEDSDESSDVLYNGAVEAVSSLLGAAAAFITGLLPFNWEYVGYLTIAVGSLFEGVMLYLFSISQSIWIGYVTYSAFVVVFQSLITITIAEVARNINEDSYALIFGVNTLLSLILQSILTVVVTSGSGLALSARPQYVVYGCYFGVLGFIYCAVSIYSVCFKTPSVT